MSEFMRDGVRVLPVGFLESNGWRRVKSSVRGLLRIGVRAFEILVGDWEQITAIAGARMVDDR